MRIELGKITGMFIGIAAGNAIEETLAVANSLIDNGPIAPLESPVPAQVAPLGAFTLSRRFEKRRREYVKDISKLFLANRTRIVLEATLAHSEAIAYCISTSRERFNPHEFLASIIQAASEAKDHGFIANQNSLLKRLRAIDSFPLTKLKTETISDIFEGGTGSLYNSLPFSYTLFLCDPLNLATLDTVCGGDMENNRSIVGSLLGALNGVGIFPRHMIEGLDKNRKIIETANKFHQKFFSRKDII